MSDAVKQTKTAPWLRIVLFASLAANLAVVGIVGGMFFLRPPLDRDGPPRGRDFVFPETQRHDLGRNLRGAFDRDRDRVSGRSFLSGYRSALDVLRAEPFDAQAFGAALRAQGAEAEQRQAAGQRVLVDYVAALPAEDRQAYADRLEAEIEEMAQRVGKMRH